MERLKLKFVGESGFLMHNNQLANPLGRYAQEMNKKSGKRKKTVEDIWELARIEWEGGMYLYEGLVQIPMRMVNKTLERGATKQKNGALWKSGAIVENDFHPLKYKGKTIAVSENGEIPNPELDEFFEKYIFQTMVKVGQATILRTRPLFDDWSFEASIAFEGSVIDEQLVLQAAADAGRLVGIGDWRIEKGGGFGRFRVEVV
jgi:hypothetical protein